MASKRKKPATILVIDDDESIQILFRRMLERNSYEVDTAGTGSEAIEKLRKRFYDVALIDIRLPDMEGADLLAEMQDAGLSDTVKIILTGFSSIGSRAKALEKGADAYLVKPVKSAYMLSLIEEKLRNKKPEKNLSP